MSDQPFGEGDPYADLRQPGKVCEHEKLQRQCDLCFALRDVELLRTRIAELKAENKRLVEERDGWKLEAEAWRKYKSVSIIADLRGGTIKAQRTFDEKRLEAAAALNEAIAANDARARAKEDGHG